MLIHGDAFPFWKCCLKICELYCFWPIIIMRSPLNLKNLKYLINLRISNEQGFPLSHLSKYTTNAPNINRCRVLLGPKQDLRSTVPQRNHLMSVRFNWKPERSRQTKICQLHISVFINQQILRFQISVHNSMSVTICCRLQYLIC